MPGRAHMVEAASRSFGSEVAGGSTITARSLWRLALWGSAAAVGLLVATVASRSDVGSQRLALALSSINGGVSPSAQGASQLASRNPARGGFDAEAANRQLARDVHKLGEDRDRLTSRLIAVERNVDDITGSITRQIAAVKTAATQSTSAVPWPAGAPTIAAIPAPAVAGLGPVGPAPTGLPLQPIAATAAPADGSTPAATMYGIDVGSALTIQPLRTRWAELRAAHPQLFDGLRPVVALREVRSHRIELRLLVGPLPNAEAAAQLCASLAPSRTFCQPTMFDGQRLALD